MGACVTVEEDAVAPGKVAPVKGITGVRADGKSTAEDVSMRVCATRWYRVQALGQVVGWR